MKVDTDRGYLSKPKPIKGYKLELDCCECGCKKSYWYYVENSAKAKSK